MAMRPLVLLKVLPALAWLALAGHAAAADGAVSGAGGATASSPAEAAAQGGPGDGERASAPDPDARKPLNRYDTDGDGQLSARERSAARKERMEWRAEMLEKYDSDGDGRLNRAEQAAARADGVRRGAGRGGRTGGSGGEAAAPPSAVEAPSEQNPE